MSDNNSNNNNETTDEIINWALNQSWTLMAGVACGLIASFVLRGLGGRQSSKNPSLTRHFLNTGSLSNCKMTLVIRTDLGMSKGKVAAQCAHAAVGCYKAIQKIDPDVLKAWETFGQTKVTVKADGGEEELMALKEKAQSLGLVAVAIRDAGKTQIQAGSYTVLGVGPGPADMVDQVTGHLKLY